MKKILYVEDEPNQIMLVQARLEQNGYQCIAAEDGEIGLKKAIEEKPDLVLLDIFLPKMSGFEVCRLLKQNPETKDIPVMILTASGVEYVDEQAKTAGANACLMKPYEGAVLIAQIKVLLGEIK
ncbi:MAG: response regulator [Candidatus Omnitrophica bacterium]|nr:response regulator [Candidatus Omnitrophota bacterium]